MDTDFNSFDDGKGPSTVSLLQETLAPFLKGIPLENVYPPLAVAISQTLSITLERSFGSMDKQVIRYFFLNKKPLHVLEPKKEIYALFGSATNENTPLSKIQDPEITPENMKTHIIEAYLFNKGLVAPSPKAYLSKALENIKTILSLPFKERTMVNARNQLWVPRLKGFFNNPDYQGKSFAVVVGGGHFPGDKGLFKLLKMRGYSFTRFNPEDAKSE